jgi:hypothetical protein
MKKENIIKLMFLPVLAFLFNCGHSNKNEAVNSKIESEKIALDFSKRISITSPTRLFSVNIAKLIYVQGLNDSIEGNIVEILNEAKTKSQMRRLIEELNKKGNKKSVLEELFYRWDRMYNSGNWSMSNQNPNNNYLLHAIIPMLGSDDMDKKSVEIIFKALDKRYSENERYVIYSQSLITSAVNELDINTLNKDIKEVIKEVISPHRGKVSDNGQINLLRKSLGLSIYK